MKIYWYIAGFVLMVFLIGCGSDKGGSISTHNLHSSYDGKTQKAIISQENILKFAQAVHYLEKLDINLNVDSTSVEGRIVENHIDNNSGLGYIKFNYKDFKEQWSDDLVNGTTRIDILTLDKITGITKIKVKFDLKLTTVDNNISFYALVSSDINVIKDEYSPMITHQYRIYDQKNNEHIEILDMKESFIDDKEKVTGKLFVGSVGYVEFENTFFNYKLFGSQSSEVSLSYKDKGKIDIVFNNARTDKLYYVEHSVTKYEPPKFKLLDSYDELDYNFDELSIHYELDNSDTEDMVVQVDWFVNDKKVETPVMYELPRKYYQENDQIKVILTAVHGDMSDTKEIVFDSTYYKTQFQTSYTKEIDIVYYSNNLEFQLNILDRRYFDNIDINNTTFSWKFEKSYYGDLVSINNTQYQAIPTVKADTFYNGNGGNNNIIYLKMYNNHKVKIFKINLKIKTDYFTYITYEHFDSDIQLAYDPYLIDMNSDGRKDIVYSYSQPSDNYHKLMIRFQDENGDFYSYETYDLIKFDKPTRIVQNDILDLNNDGLRDIVLYTSYNTIYFFFQNQNQEFELSKILSVGENWNISDVKFENLNQDGLKDMIVEIYDKEHVGDGERHLQIFYQQQNKSWEKKFDIKLERVASIDYKLTDLNQDGLKDMVLTSYSYFSNFRSLIKVLYQDTNMQWNKSQVLVSDTNKDNSYSSYLYDTDQDGTDEIFINSDIYRFTGDLLEKTSTLPITFKFHWESAQKGNFNSDGLSDIILKNDKNRLFLLLTDGVDNFNVQEYEQTNEISRIFVNDLNYDGLDDLVVYTNSFSNDSKLSLYLNKGNQFNISKEYVNVAFNNIKINSGYWKDVWFGDFDGDGFKDINIGDNNIAFLNANNLEVKPLYFPNTSNFNTQIFDFNGDGIDDIIKMSSDGKMHVALSKKN